MVRHNLAMYLIIYLEHLCVALIYVMRADLISGALGYQFVCRANDSRIFCLITSVRVKVIYGAAGASSCADIVAVLLICAADASEALCVSINVISPGFGLR